MVSNAPRLCVCACWGFLFEIDAHGKGQDCFCACRGIYLFFECAKKFIFLFFFSSHLLPSQDTQTAPEI